MNNIELLKLAAKAVGYRICTIQHDKLVIYADNGRTFHWNPLNDDGDALRLRNRIGAVIYDDGNSVTVLCDNTMLPRVEVQIEYKRDLPDGSASQESVDEATRLAITTAGAEVAKLMP